MGADYLKFKPHARRKKPLTTDRYRYDENLFICANESRVKVGLKPLIETTKKCLKCGENFTSQGAHNRLCQYCINQNQNHTEWEGLGD